MSTNALKRLIKTSLSKRINKKLFASLLEQLLTRETISDSQLGETLINLSESFIGRKADAGSVKRLQIEYALEFATSNSENLKRFFRILSQASHRCQHWYISFLKSQLVHIISKSLMDDFREELVNYTLNLETEGVSNSDSTRLWYSLIFLWSALVRGDRSVSQQDSFKKAASAIKRTTEASKDPQTGVFVARNFGVLTGLNGNDSMNDHHLNKHETTSSVTGKIFSFNQNGKKFYSYIALKKFIWLNEHFRQWNFYGDLTQAFTKFFNLQELSHTDLAQELIHTHLNGFITAVKSDESHYVVFNWRNFILTDLIQDLKRLASANSRMSDEWCDVIISAVNSCSQDLKELNEGKDLAREFLRGSIYEEVITLEKFLSNYPAEANNLSPSLISHEKGKLNSTDFLASEFNSKLGNVNMEFTSLEESQLIEYFRNLTHTDLKFSIAKQQRLASLMEELLGSLIREKNNEKLSWVTLILSNVPAIANYTFYRNTSGPWLFLNKIINYIDNESFAVDEDDGNFQDTYACFGVLLTGVISIATLFGTELSTIALKGSYTIEFVNGFFFRQFNTLTDSYQGTDDSERQIIANYEKLFTEWANALFDVNNDGLSDDLLKSIGVKQIYKFIIILFRQAFTARSIGALDETSLNNGIDYLSQNFLAPCSLESIQWICSRIGPLHEFNEAMVEIVLRIVESNVGDSSAQESTNQNYTFRMILNVIGPELMRKLTSLGDMQPSENVVRLKKIIMNETDSEYCCWSKSRKDTNMPPSSIKDEISTLLKETKPATTHQTSETWRKIRRRWNCDSASEIFHVLLEDVGLCLGPRGSTLLDESKLLVDFYAFMLISSCSPNSEKSNILFTGLNSANEIKSSTDHPDPKFSLTINDHFSSIFNEDFEGSLSKELLDEQKLQPREEAMGDFEMGDLFEDMSDNFFGDSFTKPNADGALANEPSSADIESLFNALSTSSTPLWSIFHLMKSSVYAESKHLSEHLRTRLNEELQRWRATHGY